MQKIKAKIKSPIVEDYAFTVELPISKKFLTKAFVGTIYTSYDDSAYLIEDEGNIQIFHLNKMIDNLHSIKKNGIVYSIIEILEIKKIHY